MNIFDFGKNTQQCSVTFKFDCLGSETISKLVQHYLLKQKMLTTIAPAEPRPSVILSKGDGSEARPYYQLRLSGNEIGVWAGFNVRYETWQQWRDQVLAELFLIIEYLPIEYLLAVTSQLGVGVPPEKFQDPGDIPQLEAIRAFYGRFLPPELIGRGNVYMVSTDPEGKQTVTWWIGSPDGQTEDAVSCSVRLNILDASTNLAKNVQAHVKSADDLFERFHSNFLSLFLKR